jgi:hypothetical protein
MLVPGVRVGALGEELFEDLEFVVFGGVENSVVEFLLLRTRERRLLDGGSGQRDDVADRVGRRRFSGNMLF